MELKISGNMKKILVTCVIIIVALSAILLYFDETNNVTIRKTKNEIDEKTPNETPIEITEPEKNEESIFEESEKVGKKRGILPAFAIVKSEWKKISDTVGLLNIRFWVRGRGRHTIAWQLWSDFDGDGEWDLWGPDTPVCKKWTALFFPIRHFRDRLKCRSQVHPKVLVKYWLDGKAFTKIFPG
jgi:hypothetical protein